MGMVSTDGVAFWLFTGPEGFHLSEVVALLMVLLTRE